jgi:hypothetical protein
MAMKIDPTGLSFLAGGETKAVMDFNDKGAQKQVDGKPVFDTRIVVLSDEDEAEIVRVRTAGAPVALKHNQPVKVTKLEIRPWEVNGGKGLTYWAAIIEPLTPGRAS